MLEEIGSETSFTLLEEEVRRFWRRHNVPEAFRTARRDGPARVIYQQPLAVAGQSRSDQVRLLAVTDLLARYYAMQGNAVYRQAGWTCHGLAVEVAVERSSGPDLADWDLAQFNAACREAALAGMCQSGALAERLGVWLDPVETYATMAPQSIGAVWGALGQLRDAGQLEQQCRVVSVCPRCATPLSTLEAARRAVETDTCAIWLRLPWDGAPDAYFLVWVPIPWTLVGMVALAVHPDASYSLVELAGRKGQPATHLLLAEAALEQTLTGKFRLIRHLTGRTLRGARYRPPFTFRPMGDGPGQVVLSEAVPLEQGTGLLPVTPSFDAQSLALAQAHDLPVPDLLDGWGNLNDSLTPWRGLSPLDAEPLLVENLQARGLVFRKRAERRPRPLCPYCETPLLPQARAVWQVETASGPWILGRDRVWGAPLPIWVCEQCQETVCVASLDDLAGRTGLDVAQIAPHRPAVDQLTFPCGACGGKMHRVAPVVDAAFEAAVLPWTIVLQRGPANHSFARHGMGASGSAESNVEASIEPLSRIDRSGQSLAVGQGDRYLGWLGDVAETAALLQGTLGWEQALALPEGEAGAGLDRERAQPADALRWAVYTHTTPAQAEHDFLRPLWRLVLSLPGDRAPRGQEVGKGDEPSDHWLPARLHQAIGAVTGALDRCDPQQAARELARLVDDVTGWYAARRPGGEVHTLEILCRLLAPFTPHLAEAIHRQTIKKAVDSIHLSRWPLPDPAWED